MTVPESWLDQSTDQVIKLVSVTLGLVMTASSYPRSLGAVLDQLVEADMRDKESRGIQFQTVHVPDGITILVGQYERGMVGYIWMDQTVVLVNFDALDPLSPEGAVLIGEILSSVEKNPTAQPPGTD